MTVRTLRCTDRAYDRLLAIYGTDNAVWAAAFVVHALSEIDGEQALRNLCCIHAIDPNV